MKFAQTSYGGLSFGLLLIRPDWARKPIVTHRKDTLIGEGRTTIEERRPERASFLLSQKFLLSPVGADLDDWRKGLAALGERPVAMPLWIDALPVSRWAERIYEAEKVINFDPDTGASQIYDRTSLPGVPAYSHYAPLLLGRWQKRPPAAAVTDEEAEIELELGETRPWAWRIGINAYGSGWSKSPNWISAPKDASDYGLELIQLPAAAAEPALDRRNAAARWTQDAEFLFLSRLEIRQALTWFFAKDGAVQSWSPVPAFLQPGTSTSATPDDYTARFASDTLTLTYELDEVATARIGFIQEISTPGRSQAQPGETYLYQLIYDPDTSNPELFTNWDAPLTVTEGAYQPRQIAHQEILRSLKPQDEKAEIQMAYVAGSLAADWILARLFGLLRLKIWKCDPANPAGTRGNPVFAGVVQDIRPEGNTLTLTATLFGGLLSRRTPGWVFGPRCNTYIFSPLCKLVEADFRSAGTASASDLSADRMTLTVHGVAGWSGPTYPDNLFAYGILRTGSGRATQIASIVGSSTSSGNLVVKLNRPLWPDLISAGQAVQLVPGCGGQYETDCGRFGNKANFRGFPFIPEYIDTREGGAPHTPKK